ncbi:MAG: Ig-like domain-containing protein, partial [Candidatus Bipolaricaulis sp.]|nr:Ig-like domain-containing protein [Candidatus Bipolaricaulis sp.]
IQAVADPSNGTAAIDRDALVYVPDPDFHGVERFEYAVSDGFGGTASGVVTVTVTDVNDDPMAQDDAAVTDEDVPVVILVLSNDADPEGDALVVQSLTQPHSGAAAKAGNAVRYSPEANFFGDDSFAYTVSDGRGGTTTATVTVSVIAVNDDPTAQADSASTDEDVPVEIFVLVNDSDPDGDPLAIGTVTQPGSGTVVKSSTSLIYTPSPDFRGVDSFEYSVSDGFGGTASGVVTIAVAAVNDGPEARDDSAATDEDTAIAILVLDNDADADGDDLTIQAVTQPIHGSVTASGTSATYTPDRDFHGEDSFTYTVTDGRGGSSGATVFIRVSAVNDEPLAQDDGAFTDEGSAVAIDVLANDSDPEGRDLTVQTVTSPAHGTAEIRGFAVLYTPAPGFSGVDGFTYVAIDGEGGSASAQVTINVAVVNHAPSAVGGHVDTDEDVAITIAVPENDTDPDGDALTLQSVTQPTHGSLTKSGATVTYTPNGGFHGDDAFTYTISDGRGGTASGTITITVADVNDPPIARDDGASTNEDASLIVSVLANDSDPDGDPLVVDSVTAPSSGDVEVRGPTVVYTPAAGFFGVDTFTYSVGDGRGGFASGAVTIHVAGVNDLPSAADDDAATPEDVPVTVAVLANDDDADGDTLTIESLTAPVHGVAMRAGGAVVYTPASGFSGEDAFTYTVADGNGGTDTATVTVTVIAVNDAPIAQDDAAATSEETAVTVDVLGNDRDPDGDDLAVQSVNQPSHGAVANGRSAVTYTPQVGYSGTDAFSYTVSDGRGGSATAQVLVTVVPVNRMPVAQDDSASMTGESILMIEVLANDSDPDGDFLLVQSIGTPAHGTLLNSRTAISYIPDAGFSGVDTFSYMVSDGNGGSATAVVTVSVAAANQEPVAGDDSGVTDEDVPVAIAVLDNDLDLDGDGLRVESISQPRGGSVVQDGATITYTPAAGRSGVDTFTYTVSDGRGGTATATVMVVVVEVNDPPIAQDDSATTDTDAEVSIAVLENDTDPEGGALAVVSAGQGQNGTVFNEGASLLYTPDPGFVGTDTFTYTMTDGDGLTATATVTVGVAGVTGGGGASEGTALSGRVIINEVAWAGTVADAQDEWIELRNLGAAPVDLAGWTLQWRRTRPVAPEDYVWKAVKLSGTLAAASASSEFGDNAAGISVRADESSDAVWHVSYDPARDTRGYFLLERTRDETVGDVPSGMLYDATRSPTLALSDLGEVILLVNAAGDIVDTANASSAGRDVWAAGSKTTLGTMERVDPYGADVAENWSTNAGVVTRGVDAQKRPLYGTPGTRNSPRLETLYERAGTKPLTLRAGGPLEVSFGLSRAERKTTGWPWIVTTRPGLDLAAGAGGSVDSLACSFSGRAKSSDEYVLEIGTSGAAPGAFVFWIVYGKGKALLVPVRITP